MNWELELGGAPAEVVALAIVSSACLLGLMFWWKRHSNRRATEATGAGAVGLHASMVRIQEELPRLLRSMSSQLNAKMRALSDLVAVADDKIATLRRLNAGVTPNPEPVVDQSHNSLRAIVSESHARSAAHSSSTDLADRVQVFAVSSHTPNATELRSQRYAHVYALADGGQDAAEIAAETGMHRGEVELVLSLRRKRVRVDRGGRSEPNRVVSLPEEATV